MCINCGWLISYARGFVEAGRYRSRCPERYMSGVKSTNSVIRVTFVVFNFIISKTYRRTERFTLTCPLNILLFPLLLISCNSHVKFIERITHLDSLADIRIIYLTESTWGPKIKVKYDISQAIVARESHNLWNLTCHNFSGRQFGIIHLNYLKWSHWKQLSLLSC